MNIIVAFCNKKGIGLNNSIPWKIISDLRYFKKVTSYSNNPILKNVVIMGRKTWESIPLEFRPLHDRINIILSKEKNFKCHGGFVCDSLNDAVNTIKSINNVNMDNIFIIGGDSVYKQVINNSNIKKIYVTEIYKKYNCDTHFPEIPDKFKLISVSSFKEENNIYFRYLVYINNRLNNYNTYNFIWNNKEEQQYLDCLNEILTVGIERNDRTGVGTLSLFGKSFKYNLSDTFPLLTTKKMFTRGIFEELKFYLIGKTDNTILNNKNVNIWNGNTSRDFLDKRGLNHYPEGDMGETYGFNFRHYGADYNTCKDDYKGQGYDQVENAIHLIKTNPESRRIIIDIWNCSTIHKSALPPCLCKYQFYVNTIEKTLDLMIYIRSSDFFLANNWNTCTGAFLVHMICNLKGIDLSPGILTVITGDTHIYNTHIDQVKENLKRHPRPFPKLVIKEKKDDINDFEYSDIEILGYNPYPNIPAPMAV